LRDAGFDSDAVNRAEGVGNADYLSDMTPRRLPSLPTVSDRLLTLGKHLVSKGTFILGAAKERQSSKPSNEFDGARNDLQRTWALSSEPHFGSPNFV
jgi:hypothetical protein